MNKICKKCRTEKPLAEFHNASRSKDGRHARCKACRHDHAISTRAQRREYNQAYYAANGDKIKNQWHENREQNLAKHAQYYTTVRGRAVRLINSARKSPDGCTLTLDHVVRGIERGSCPVTGIAFDLRTSEQKRSGRQANPFAPSLDRIDPSQGYTDQNTRVVVWHYNAMKGELSDSEVLEICRRVVEMAL